ncbi:MAG TPA: sulfate adenylyltransferase subunit CysD [Bryobacteraceae bacterium]|nr:sulfate adenylyltransferase subunit CysD [Bryobacteraceae bacterium]
MLQTHAISEYPPMPAGDEGHLRMLEAESIHIFREVVAEFARPVMLYSIGKDSSVMLRLAQKAFYPGKLPFPLLHVDTGYKFREMIEFRDRTAAELGATLIVHTNRAALAEGANPFRLGTQRCCALLKTRALLDALKEGGFDAAFGGARREEEKSRAKERIFSFRDSLGQWDPRNQRPELWNLFNSRIDKGESIRVFPLSNWTELDIWHYIHLENIPVVPLYFAKPRPMLVRGETLIPVEHDVPRLPGEEPQMVMCRMRSLGCTPCTGAIRSSADTVPKIIAELVAFRRSERENRVIDHDQDGSMEIKKREGYF